MPPVIQIAIDCHDADRLISFWTAALGYVTEPPPDGWDSWLAYWQAAGIPDEDLQGAEKGSGAIIDPTGSGPRVFFQEVPEPKVVKNRVHLDIKLTGGLRVPLQERRAQVDGEVERLVGLGATVAYRNAPEGSDFSRVYPARPGGQRVLRGLRSGTVARPTSGRDVAKAGDEQRDPHRAVLRAAAVEARAQVRPSFAMAASTLARAVAVTRRTNCCRHSGRLKPRDGSPTPSTSTSAVAAGQSRPSEVGLKRGVTKAGMPGGTHRHTRLLRAGGQPVQHDLLDAVLPTLV